MAELREAGIEAVAVPGQRGQLDVLAEGALAFSMQRSHRFPEPGEIVALLGSSSG